MSDIEACEIFSVGDRVMFSDAWFTERRPRQHIAGEQRLWHGRIVGFCGDWRCARVKWDERKTPVALATKYMERVS